MVKAEDFLSVHVVAVVVFLFFPCIIIIIIPVIPSVCVCVCARVVDGGWGDADPGIDLTKTLFLIKYCFCLVPLYLYAKLQHE